ncbi:TPA: hypothetical protein LNF34_003564 [Vibrio cholerae]|uniref:hypothetical protein n=1 Tax=Vibrio cholerae TaxID=666 RepID=UPI001E439018|nr:hypothetical protein [Vibrio cholerae]MCD6644662.1 hypothetical protein [Vibrio cholerae]HBK7239934.1 hypothetical protein [Vibrio cholerae]
MSEKNDDSMDDFSLKDKELNPKGFVSHVQKEELKELAHSRFRKNILTVSLILLVLVMNWYVIDYIRTLSFMEMEFISKQLLSPESRVVSETVVLSLLGGTVAQVSALLFVVVKSSFNNGDSDGNGKSSD